MKNWLEKSKIKFKLGNNIDAEKNYRYSLSLNSSDVIANCNLGYIEMMKGNLLAAETLLQRSIKLDPDYRLAWENLLQVRYRLYGKYRALGTADEFLKHHAQANIQFAKKFFKQREVQMEHLFISKSDFDKEVVNYSVSVNADLMAIMNLNRSGVMGVIGSNYEQHLITNDAKIPVLFVNPIDQGPARGYSTAFG